MARLFPVKGYSVVETVNIAAVRDGRMISQYKLSTALDAAGAENGQLLSFDHVAKEVGLPASGNAYVGLHASDERVYETGKGFNDFVVHNPNLPRVIILAEHDKFETNAVTVAAAATSIDTVTKLKSVLAAGTTPVYGRPSTSGDIELVTTLGGSETVVLRAVSVISLPNGQEGVRFVVATA